MDARGALTGGLVGVGFGLVFVLVNSAGLGGWTTVLRVAAVVVAVVVVVDLVRRLGPAAGPGGPAAASDPTEATDPIGATGPAARRVGPWSRGYLLVVAAEAVALFGGVQVVVRLLDAPRYAIAWVAFVVGVHFVGLALLWRVRRFHLLAAAMVGLAVVAVVAGAAGASDAVVRLVAGVGSGVVLLVFAATSGRRLGPGPVVRA